MDNLMNDIVDRNIHIHCYGEDNTVKMAYQAKKHEHGDLEVGSIHSCSML